MDYDQQQRGMYQHSQQLAQPKDLGKISHPSDKEFHLELLTQPLQSIATEWTDDKKPRSHKKRKSTDWPLEPPPVIALRIVNGTELEYHNALTACPNVFCLATLTNADGHPVSSETMRGRHSSSLIKLDKGKSPKLQTDAPAIGVFLFDQVHIRYPGQYCLLFTLFEMQMHDQGMHAVVHNVVRSNPFTVLPQPKRLPKPDPPSEILLALAAQGAKIKIRKPNEERAKKRTDWSIDASEHDITHHAPMMPYHHAQLPTLPMSMSMSMPQPNFMPPPMTMASPQYQMSAPAQSNQTMYFPPSSVAPDMNFGAFPDPNQTYYFGGQYQPQNFGNGFGGL